MIALILYALCALYVVHLWHGFRKIRQQRKVLSKIPGPEGLPVLGVTLDFAFTPRNKVMERIAERHIQYGHIFRMFFGNKALVSVAQADAAEVILTSRTNIDKAFGYEFFHEWLGTGLLTSTESERKEEGGIIDCSPVGMFDLKIKKFSSKWHKKRKMLTPAFHFSILDTFYESFVENGKIFTQKLEKELNSKWFDIYTYVNNCTLDIICETAMGVRINAQEKHSDYTDAIKDVNELLIYRVLRPWLWPDLIYGFTNNAKRESKALSILHHMSSSVIRERKEARKQLSKNNDISEDSDLGIKKRKAFLDLLLEISENSSEQLSDSDLREEVDTFMFAGHDTTSTSLSWVIYLLGLFQDIQNKVIAEIEDVLGSSDDPPTMKQLSEMKYIDAVMKESLRLYPAVPFIGRTLTEKIQLEEYVVPAETIVQVNIASLHRNPKHFPNPDEFDPENFSVENIKSRHTFAFIPFSAGPRNCIGQKFALLEEKVLLVMLLRKFKITSLDKREDISLLPETVLRSENGIRVKIERRE